MLFFDSSAKDWRNAFTAACARRGLIAHRISETKTFFDDADAWAKERRIPVRGNTQRDYWSSDQLPRPLAAHVKRFIVEEVFGCPPLRYAQEHLVIVQATARI